MSHQIAPKLNIDVNAVVKTLNQFTEIFGSPSRKSVDITCLKYETLLIGREVCKMGGYDLLELVYSQLMDSTGEIKAVWAKI